MKKYISEFTGTALYVFFGCGSAVIANLLFNAIGVNLPLAYTNLLIALAFGLTYMAVWFFLHHISGCHLNPAVSFAKLIAKELSVKDFAGYIIGQFAGGFAGAALIILIIGGRFSFYANQYGMGSVLGTQPATAFIIEMILTFVLVSVFLKVTEKNNSSGISGLAIGITLIAVHIFGGPFTGTSVNPARSLGTGILQGGEAVSQLWLFILAPLTGALLAALFYIVMSRQAKEKCVETELSGETENTLSDADDSDIKDEENCMSDDIVQDSSKAGENSDAEQEYEDKADTEEQTEPDRSEE